MSFAEFYDRYSGGPTQSFKIVCDRWDKEEELENLLHTAVGTNVVLGDLLVGDGLSD